jgi:8-oxo-dGTP diphosphatase
VRTFVIQRLLFPLVRIYWKVFRPKTFGVKGVLSRAGDDSVLLARHAYGNTRIWNLPGGGFNPRRESPDGAIAREIREELRLHVLTATELGEYRTQAQGKRDTVTIFACQVGDEPFALNEEITEARWFSPSEIAELERLYPITRRALELSRATDLP